MWTASRRSHGLLLGTSAAAAAAILAAEGNPGGTLPFPPQLPTSRWCSQGKNLFLRHPCRCTSLPRLQHCCSSMDNSLSILKLRQNPFVLPHTAASVGTHSDVGDHAKRSCAGSPQLNKPDTNGTRATVFHLLQEESKLASIRSHWEALVNCLLSSKIHTERKGFESFGNTYKIWCVCMTSLGFELVKSYTCPIFL